MDPNIKALTESMMASLMESSTFVGADGADQHPVIESPEKATFIMYRHHDRVIGSKRGERIPLGVWNFKVTIEATYSSFDESDNEVSVG